MTGRDLFEFWNRVLTLGDFVAATVLLLPMAAQNAIKAGFRAQILSLIGQSWNDLAGWKTGKFRGIAVIAVDSPVDDRG